MDEKLKAFYDLFERRRSIREFSDKEIEKDKLERLLQTLRRAQSAANRQPWHFILIEKENRERFNSVFTREGFKAAPLVIVACAEPEKAWVRKQDSKNYAWVDVAIALTEMIGAATAEGIGTCWVAAVDTVKVKEILGIPESMDVVALIAAGYPKAPLAREEKNRKSLEEIIHYAKW